jgi:hypothetical protein
MGCHNEHLSTLTFLTEHSWSLLRSVDLKGGGKGCSLRTNNGMFNYIIICPEPSDIVFVWCRRTYNGFHWAQSSRKAELVRQRTAVQAARDRFSARHKCGKGGSSHETFLLGTQGVQASPGLGNVQEKMLKRGYSAKCVGNVTGQIASWKKVPDCSIRSRYTIYSRLQKRVIFFVALLSFVHYFRFRSCIAYAVSTGLATIVPANHKELLLWREKERESSH